MQVEDTILYEQVDKGYGKITLNRQEKRNAISQAMAATLSSLLDELKEDPPKFLVIKSAGEKAFCAGGDLTELHGELSEDEAYTLLSPIRNVLYKIATFPTPTICLLQGSALGGGCELATACDIRIAKEGTKFGFVQSNLGILPGWGGGTLLQEKMNPSFALQWITEGAIFPAETLEVKGWLNHIIAEEHWDNEKEILKPYINKSYEQLSFLKKQYLQLINEGTLRKRMEKESRKSAFLWPSEEHRRAVSEFLKK